MKLNDKVRVSFILNENRKNEKHITDSGIIVSIKDNMIGIATDNLKPKIWFADIENVKNIKDVHRKKKPKLLSYCDKPACFTHYLANHKIKEIKEKTTKEKGNREGEKTIL